jgi:tetratricopeptide (TPR) repeat protein
MKKGIFLLTLIFLFLGCPSAPLNTARIAYFNEQDYEHAKAACLNGIKTEPEQFEYYCILGGSEIGLGNWQSAAEAFVQAFERDSSKTTDWLDKQEGNQGYYYQGIYNAARDLYGEKKYEKALAYLGYAALIDPTDVRTFTLKGAMQYIIGNKEEANREYQKALKIDPKNPDVHLLIGKSLFENKKFTGAITYFGSAIKHYNPQYTRVKKILFQNLAEINEAIEHEIIRLWAAKNEKELDKLVREKLGFSSGLSAQERNIDKLYKITDGIAHAYYFQGMSYYYLKNDSLALQNLHLCLNLMPDDLDALFYCGEILIRFKKFKDAISKFQKITESMPEDFAAWFYLGVCYSEVKDYQKAIKIYEEKALPLQPDNIDLMTNLAYAYREVGNNKKAFEYLMEADALKKEKK